MAEVGGASIGRKWLHWPERCRSGRMTVHRASRPFLTVDEHGEGLVQRKPTNAQIPLELH